MFGLLMTIPLALPAVVVLVALLVPGRAHALDRADRLRQVARTTRFWRLAGVALGVAAAAAAFATMQTPWPGSFYTLPLIALVAVGCLAAAVALVRITRQPRQGEDLVLDELLRRRAAGAVVAAVGLLAAVPTAGVAAMAALALGGTLCRPAAWTAAAVALPVLVPVAAVIVSWCAIVLARTAVRGDAVGAWQGPVGRRLPDSSRGR